MKKLRSNSKEVREAIKLHLIEIAQNDDVEVKTVEQAKKYIIERFNLEVLRFARRNESIQDLYTYWISGLALHTYHYTADIIDYLHSIGLYGKNEKQEQEKAADLYHYLIFKEVSIGF
jgi:hypothetical protein